jgi:exopolysaccharide biosynthesis WecB/TagA/CpsF family protein
VASERKALVARINETEPDVLLVALGNPMQEAWIADRLPALRVKVAIGVGALFDYLAGAVPRAPVWIRRLGAEWVYRLLMEPWRLWRRYVIGNPRFLFRVVTNGVAHPHPFSPGGDRPK